MYITDNWNKSRLKKQNFPIFFRIFTYPFLLCLLKFITLCTNAFRIQSIILHRYLCCICRSIHIPLAQRRNRPCSQLRLSNDFCPVFHIQAARVSAVQQGFAEDFTDRRSYRAVLALALIRRRSSTARYGMGNLVGYVMMILLFDFTYCLSMRSIHQSRKDIRFQIVFQAAAVNSGINQRGTARIGQVDG